MQQKQGANWLFFIAVMFSILGMRAAARPKQVPTKAPAAVTSAK